MRIHSFFLPFFLSIENLVLCFQLKEKIIRLRERAGWVILRSLRVPDKVATCGVAGGGRLACAQSGACGLVA